MAVTSSATSPASGPAPRETSASRPVALRHFVRLKLRILGNSFRGRVSKALMSLLGLIAGIYLAALGFLLFAAGAAGDAQVRLMIASLGGAVLVLSSVILPVIWFGVDDTLDPARFALLPLSRWRLVSGLLVAAAVGVPGAALLLATTGLLVPAAVHGGPLAALLQAAGIAGGLLLCLAAGRAVTSTFATTLRSRRVRDLLWVLIACVAALLGPLQLAVLSAVQRAEWDQLASVARVVGWTPLGAPYTVGFEVAEGRPVAALAKLAITAAAVAGLLWWWGRALESALSGAAGGGPGRARGTTRAGACAQLLPRLLPGLPGTAFGGLVAREVRYWWRDVRRRSSIIMIGIVGLFVPLVFTAGAGAFSVDGDRAEVGFSLTQSSGTSPAALYLTMLFVSVLAGSALANQFGYDGTAYAAHLTSGVPGQLELRARAAAHAVLLVPLLLVVATAMALVHGAPGLLVGALGVLFAGYGTSLATNQMLSVLAPYALPETSNPFATGTGSATAKSMLALVGLLGSGALASPVLIAAMLLGGVWPWLALPVGIGYGLGAALLGSFVAGDQLRRRGPELLAAVTPNR